MPVPAARRQAAYEGVIQTAHTTGFCATIPSVNATARDKHSKRMTSLCARVCVCVCVCVCVPQHWFSLSTSCRMRSTLFFRYMIYIVSACEKKEFPSNLTNFFPSLAVSSSSHCSLFAVLFRDGVRLALREDRRRRRRVGCPPLRRRHRRSITGGGGGRGFGILAVFRRRQGSTSNHICFIFARRAW